MDQEDYGRVLSALRKWKAAQNAGLDCLGRASRAVLQRSHLLNHRVGDRRATELAAMRLEDIMVHAHAGLSRALDDMVRRARRGLTVAQRSALEALRTVQDERSRVSYAVAPDRPTYAERERDFLLDLVAQVHQSLQLQLEANAKIVDDVLWCESRDAHTIYNAAWLMQPSVEDEPVLRLRDVCKWHLGDTDPD